MVEYLENHQELVTLIFSAVVALSTVVYAVLTALLVAETRHMRRAQTEPKLVAYVKPREEFVNFAHLYIKNVGAGPAFNVSFELTTNKNDEGGNILIRDFKESRFLETGVDYIGPNQKLHSRYTKFNDNFDKKIMAKIMVKINYKSSTNRNMSDTYAIDMSQFEGAGNLGTPHLYSIAKSLKNLQEDVNRISTGFKRVKVDTYTHEDRRREEREWEERWSEQSKEK